MTSTLTPDDPATGAALRTGELEILGRIPWSSNGTFVATVTTGDHRLTAIYKPERGERPLWDFPAGLWRRERAARLLDAHLGWGFVPPTEVRHEAPLGVGTLQYFVPSDPEVTAFELAADDRHTADLMRLAAFDVVANNTDRKAGHCLAGADGRIYAIDHGLCFHAEEKLRTVLWDFAGRPLEAALRERLAQMSANGLDSEFDELLDAEERAAMIDRAHRLAGAGVLPSDPTGRRYPWPLV
ncbi:MAG: SCO1664 family protein [Microthrixaceae bacterium]